MSGLPIATNRIYDTYKYDVDYKDFYGSSTRRDKNIYPDPNGYELELDESVDKIVEVEVIDLQLPYTFYNVDTTNNKLYFDITLTSPNPSAVPVPPSVIQTGFIYVAPGHYTTTELAIELQRQFNQLFGDELNKITVTYLPSPGKFFFFINANYYTGAGNTFSLLFKDKPEAMSKAIGFSPDTVSVTSTSQIPTFAPKPDTQPYQTGWYTDDLGGTTPGGAQWGVVADVYQGYIISETHIINDKFQQIFLKLIPQLTGTSYSFAETTTDGQDEIPLVEYHQINDMFGIIPINAPPGYFITVGSQSGAYRAAQYYDQPVDFTVKRIKLEWYDENGNLLDFNGADHSFMLRFVTLNKRVNTTQFSSQVTSQWGNLERKFV